jgi:hypothetical protein
MCTIYPFKRTAKPCMSRMSLLKSAVKNMSRPEESQLKLLEKICGKISIDGLTFFIKSKKTYNTRIGFVTNFFRTEKKFATKFFFANLNSQKMKVRECCFLAYEKVFRFRSFQTGSAGKPLSETMSHMYYQ